MKLIDLTNALHCICNSRQYFSVKCYQRVIHTDFPHSLLIWMKRNQIKNTQLNTVYTMFVDFTIFDFSLTLFPAFLYFLYHFISNERKYFSFTFSWAQVNFHVSQWIVFISIENNRKLNYTFRLIHETNAYSHSTNSL